MSLVSTLEQSTTIPTCRVHGMPLTVRISLNGHRRLVCWQCEGLDH